jgi:tRNA1Val (adenine37-N6)-methyltransferase
MGGLFRVRISTFGIHFKSYSMSNAYFKFKQFTVHQEHCAMKVGTDGVLLGAWAEVENARTALDVGTGTGLIALMLAQRNPELHIAAIEIDKTAARQAQANVEHSPWKERITVHAEDFRSFDTSERFNLIVSNPPYFLNALNSPNEQRNMARHAGGLNYELLCSHSFELLNEGGKLCIIVPAEVETAVMDVAFRHHLSPTRRVQVFTKPGKPCRRLLLSFTKPSTKLLSDIDTFLPSCSQETLYIETANQRFTPEYIALTREFYLNM